MLEEGLIKLGIDWKGILMYVVNFGVILYLLSKFLYKPLLKFLDERKAVVENTLRSAEEQKREFETVLEQKKGDSEKMFQEITEAKKNIDAERRKILQKAEEERLKILETARKEALLIQEEVMSQTEDELINRITKVIDAGMRNKVSSQNIQLAIKEVWRDIKNQKKENL